MAEASTEHIDVENILDTSSFAHPSQPPPVFILIPDPACPFTAFRSPDTSPFCIMLHLPCNKKMKGMQDLRVQTILEMSKRVVTL